MVEVDILPDRQVAGAIPAIVIPVLMAPLAADIVEVGDILVGGSFFYRKSYRQNTAKVTVKNLLFFNK